MLLSELEYGSYLSYTPRGDSDISKQSKNLVLCLKTEGSIGDPEKYASAYITGRLVKDMSKLPFRDFFQPNVFLVPIPKSSLMKPGSLWVSNRIAQEMSKAGLGIYCECLKRVTAVQKAASAPSGQRPSALEHFLSLECILPISKPREIVLVDDVITKGATALGSASRLKSALPDAHVRAFTIFRTISDAQQFQKIFQPVVGIISNINGTLRNP